MMRCVYFFYSRSRAVLQSVTDRVLQLGLAELLLPTNQDGTLSVPPLLLFLLTKLLLLFTSTSAYFILPMGQRLPFSNVAQTEVDAQSFSSQLPPSLPPFHPLCLITPTFSYSSTLFKASLEFPINLTPFASITSIKNLPPSHHQHKEIPSRIDRVLSPPPLPPTFNHLNSPQLAAFIINCVE